MRLPPGQRDPLPRGHLGPVILVTPARAFADEMSLPAVFHCAAGKDRTGVLAAVVLDAVGVSSAAVIADYALTAQRIRQITARLLRLETYREMMARSAGVKGAATADEASMAGFLAPRSPALTPQGHHRGRDEGVLPRRVRGSADRGHRPGRRGRSDRYLLPLRRQRRAFHAGPAGQSMITETPQRIAA